MGRWNAGLGTHFPALVFQIEYAMQLKGRQFGRMSGAILIRGTANSEVTVDNRWNEKAGLRWDAVRSQVIDVLEAQEIKGDRQ